ncbi:MAG: aldehyde dehydrogenase family protein [Dehalococcoidales bacterium]|nr:aldehyde dehydrogenase family protein [Dehalococcoidales bacterium]
MQNYKMWIGGKWVDAESGRTFPSYDPATEEVIAQVPLGDKADVDKAVKSARQALPVWSRKSSEERSNILYRIAEAIRGQARELAELDVISHGSPAKTAMIKVMLGPRGFEYTAQMSRSLKGEVVQTDPNTIFYLKREPMGVCALVLPWNSPLLGATMAISAALSTGNACIVKPPSYSSLTVLRLGEILEKINDLPPGIVNIVTGSGRGAGEALVSHPGVDMVSFTGSCATGKRIMSCASSTVKPVQLELGGKNPFIVLEDADLDAAVERGVATLFNNTGMSCTAPGRFYVHERIYDEFVTGFVNRARKIVTGDPKDPNTDMGPVVSAEHRDRVEEYIKSGIDEGAALLLGGKRPADPPLNKGYFIMPTVFSNVTQNMKIAREEIFGPVAVIIKFSSEDEVIDLVNDTTFGLAASVWTKDSAKGIRFANEIQAGTVWVNNHQISGLEVPWGGYKESGIGKVNHTLGLEEFTKIKAISLDLKPQRN